MVCGTNLLHILALGAAEWNAFRDQNPDWVMLNGASLPQARLEHVNLQRAFLLSGDLRGANLEGGHLESAILRHANLRGSNLRGARIDNADLCEADLSGADLRGASLCSCFLMRTDLRGANLSSATGLTYSQVMQAVGDCDTVLPGDLARPAAWMATGVYA